MPEIQLDDLSVDVIYKKIKRINLSVRPPSGKISISAPKSVTLGNIREFIRKHINWIRKQKKNIQSKIYREPYQFINGEIHYFNAQAYILSITEKKTKPSVILHEGNMLMTVRPDCNIEQRKSILHTWYRVQLKLVIPILIKKYEPLMNVQVKEFGVKLMKTRWGTCNTNAKRIWLNLELAKKSHQSIEYIVVHEMVHLLEPSHNHRFKALMDKYMPQWRLHKSELNKVGI